MRTVPSHRLPFTAREAIRHRVQKKLAVENTLDQLAFGVRGGAALGPFLTACRYYLPTAELEWFGPEAARRAAYYDRFATLWRRARGLREVGGIITSGRIGDVAPAPISVIENAFHVDPDDTLGQGASDLNDGILTTEGGTGPWLTVETSLGKLDTVGGVGQSGYDVLYVHDGVHDRPPATLTDLTAGGSTDTGYNGAKIRVIAFPGDTVVLNFKQSGGICWIRHLSNGGNWSWEDLIIHCDFQAFTVDAAFTGGPGVHFKRCSQPDVAPAYTTSEDNAGTVVCWADGVGMLIEDCDFRGTHSGGANASGFFCDTNTKYWIRRSIFHNQGSGPAFHFKHPPATLPVAGELVLEFSLLYNNGGRGPWHNGPAGMSLSHVILDAGGGGPKVFGGADGGADGIGIDYSNTFDHVTAVGGSFRLFRGNDAQAGNSANNGKDNTITNSLFDTNLSIWPASGEGGTSLTGHNSTLDYNAYPTGSNILEYDTARALSAWQSHSGEDANSVEGTISFIASHDPTDPATYALAAGSAGKGAADDGSDCGANVALVGPL